MIQLAFHPTGIGFCGEIGSIFEVHELQEFVDTPEGLLFRQMVEIAQEQQMFAAGQEPIDGALLRDVTDQPSDLPRLFGDVVSQHDGPTGCRLEQRNEDSERRTLAGSVRTEEPEDFSGPHLKREPVNGSHAIVDFAERGGLNGHGPVHYPKPFMPSRS